MYDWVLLAILNQYTGSEVQGEIYQMMKDNYVLNNQRFVYCCERFKPEDINTV